MWRENRDYAITVQGDIVEGLQGADRHQRTAARSCARCEAKWPRRATASRSAGAVEESSKGRRRSPPACR